MKNNKHGNEKGFGALEGILILVIVGLVGFIGWNTWHNRAVKAVKSSSSTVSAKSTVASTSHSTTSGSAAAQPKAATFAIPELGIKLVNVPSSLSDLNYAVNVDGAQSGTTYARFSTTSLSNLDKSCSPTGHVSDDGALTRQKGTYNSYTDLQGGSPDMFVKQFSGFWISYGHPQAACSDNSTAEALHISQAADFQKLVSDPANVASQQ